ncbi:HIT domain-containing protein [Andreprevotia lacus]|nr:HIT domain-containing protein [Andreprevotia lacus]
MTTPDAMFDLDPHLIAHTRHWQLRYRRDARYPGYLLLAARQPVADLHELDAAALAALGPALQTAERLLQAAYAPCKVMHYKLGFSSGFHCHFHVVPVTEALLHAIVAHPAYSDTPDGNDAILYLSRAYCERDLSPAEAAAQAAEITRLRTLAVPYCTAPWQQ